MLTSFAFSDQSKNSRSSRKSKLQRILIIIIFVFYYTCTKPVNNEAPHCGGIVFAILLLCSHEKHRLKNNICNKKALQFGEVPLRHVVSCCLSRCAVPRGNESNSSE